MDEHALLDAHRPVYGDAFVRKRYSLDQFEAAAARFIIWRERRRRLLRWLRIRAG